MYQLWRCGPPFDYNAPIHEPRKFISVVDVNRKLKLCKSWIKKMYICSRCEPRFDYILISINTKNLSIVEMWTPIWLKYSYPWQKCINCGDMHPYLIKILLFINIKCINCGDVNPHLITMILSMNEKNSQL